MRYLILLFALLFMPISAMASVIPDRVYATTPVEIKNNLRAGHKADLNILKLGALSKDLKYENGEAVEVIIKDYVKPKRGKRDGYYKIEFNYNGSLISGKMTVAKKADLKDISIKAGTTIAGHVLNATFLPQAVAVSKGLIKPNENQTRLQSAGTDLYESTPLTYIETGMEFDVPANGIVILQFRSPNTDTEE